MKERFSLSAGAMLLCAAAVYLMPPAELTALLLPVAAHELGHLLMLWMLGQRLRAVRLEWKGLCMEYIGDASELGHIMIALAGPAAGIAYACAASALARRMGGDWLSLSAGLSLLLSVYNLLPALPLDGGRVLLHLFCAMFGDRRGRMLTEAAGLAVGLALLCLGAWLAARGYGAALLTASVWLLFCQESARGLVKRRQIV